MVGLAKARPNNYHVHVYDGKKGVVSRGKVNSQRKGLTDKLYYNIYQFYNDKQPRIISVTFMAAIHVNIVIVSLS